MGSRFMTDTNPHPKPYGLLGPMIEQQRKQTAAGRDFARELLVDVLRTLEQVETTVVGQVSIVKMMLSEHDQRMAGQMALFNEETER